jgi:hypothetical protein
MSTDNSRIQPLAEEPLTFLEPANNDCTVGALPTIIQEVKMVAPCEAGKAQFFSISF